ncbi:MAG TPA: protein kinase [Candidatus Eisenbacteria bacterium]|nr:protein kinase [Candidatus Eisenbacteria bacterium]
MNDSRTPSFHPDDHDPIDDAIQSIDDNESVDWNLTDTKLSSAGDRASARALRDLEKIAEVHRGFQHPPKPGKSGTSPAPHPEPWGPLTILELASAGQSGEVWRAWDTWLQREVALKFLLPEGTDGTGDSALLEEARSLARIRHRGVVNVHGIGAHAGRVGMWMEFLEGATLESEIDRRGPLPPGEVARIGIDLCHALDAVIAAGLVHRDIKPANIVLESSGRTVLTDFGLGKRAAVTGRDEWRSSGTPLFMAPELLAGEAATPRSDLYALGVTLRWALTGRAPFRARSLQELRVEAETGPGTRIRDERPDAPAKLISAIERAMAPRADARYATPAQFAEALETTLDDTRGARRASVRPRVLVFGGLLLLASALLSIRLLPERSIAPRGRFTIQLPATTELNPYAGNQTISPDGRLVAFVAEAVVESTSQERIWVRPLDAFSAKSLDGTEGASFLFWSPDSREIGFFTDGKMKKVAVSGGSPEVLCDAPDPRGATWGRDGVIVFAPRAAGGLHRVSSEGGASVEIQRPDTLGREEALRWPHFLPDGERYFFVSLPPRNGEFDVFVASTKKPERRRVMRAGCAPTVAGNLGVVVAHAGRLMLQGFDFDRLAPKESPVAIARVPFTNESVGQPLASASSNGIIVHLNQPMSPTKLNLLDRSGRSRAVVPLPAGRYEAGYHSPDGKRLLAQRRDSPTSVEIWLVDLVRGQSRRFTVGPQSRFGGAPAWSPDGKRIAFSSNRDGRTNIYERLVDEAGEERLLYESDGQFKEVNTWSPDGEYLVFEQAGAHTGWDLWLLPMKRKEGAIPYLTSRHGEYGGGVSPDGRWLAHSNYVDGRMEIYVRSFPEPGAEVRLFEGDGRAYWTRDGREILISHTGDGWIWSIPVRTHPTFQAGAPTRLFRAHKDAHWIHPAPSGDQFVEVRPEAGAEPASITVHVNVPKPYGD